MLRYILIGYTILFSFNLFARWETQGQLQLRNSIFENDHIEETADNEFGMMAQFQGNTNKGEFTFFLGGKGYYETSDHDRNYLQLEDTYFQYNRTSFRVTVGTKIYNWSATEFFHPADVINSRSINSRVDKREKFGQPVVQADYFLDEGEISLYLFPYFIKPLLPGNKSRVRLSTNLGEERWVDHHGDQTENKFILMPGLGINQTLGDADLRIYFLRHLDRETPVVAFEPSKLEFYPLYLMTNHLGVTYQHILPYDLIFKLEHASKFFEKTSYLVGPMSESSPKDYQMTSLSLETGISFGNGADSTFMLEGQFISGVDKNTRKSLSIFQRDIMFGHRLAFNNINSSELFAGLFWDLEVRNEYIFTMSYKQRIKDSWNIESGLLLLKASSDPDSANSFRLIENSDHFYLTLIRHF